MGAKAYTRIDEVEFIPGDVAIEIGADRGESSTPYLRSWCSQHGVRFVSVDMDPDNGDAETFHMPGEYYLAVFDTGGYPIKFAYLDNFDWEYPVEHGGLVDAPWVRDQRRRYAELGVDMTNHLSQQAHLMQAQMIAVHYSVPGSVILIDDTYRWSNSWHGKGGTAVPWLVDAGWDLLSNPAGEYSDWYAMLRRRV